MENHSWKTLQKIGCHYWVWCSFKCPVTDIQPSIFEDTFMADTKGFVNMWACFSLHWLAVRYVLSDFPPPMTWHGFEPKCLRLSKRCPCWVTKGAYGVNFIHNLTSFDQFDSWVSWHLPFFFVWGIQPNFWQNRPFIYDFHLPVRISWSIQWYESFRVLFPIRTSVSPLTLPLTPKGITISIIWTLQMARGRPKYKPVSQTLKGEEMIQSNRKRQPPKISTSYGCHLVSYLSHIKLHQCHLVSYSELCYIIWV